MNRQDRFGPFILESLLGRGGMGAVYRAKHEETGQTVAVKTLLTPLERERERFEAEISTLKLLRHENIVKLYGFGQEDGVLYYAMEYVDAPSLATLLKRGRRFAWEEVVYIGAAICRALKHAHDRGVIHRDVKPANILLLDDGGVKITDYGIAQYFGSSRLTGANQVVGTIEYMAPEQAQAGPLTPRADLYALGALMYALLTGAPPYRARSLPELLRRYNEETPESIRRARPEAPNVLDAFLRELLQISPEKRPGDARLVGRRLEGILKTATGVENGNPFLNCRFFIDGRSTVVDKETEEERDEEARVEAIEDFNAATPDIPYQPLSDERLEESDASPFERTTEVGVADESTGRTDGATATLRADAREEVDFDLATLEETLENGPCAAPSSEASANGVGDAAIAFGVGNGETEADFRAPTAVEPENDESDEKTASPETRRASDEESGAPDDWEFVEASSLDKYKRSRFTAVDEGELDALPSRNERKTLLRTARILLFLAALSGLGAFFCWVFQAPTADRLYRRIEEALRVPDDELNGALKRAEKDLRRMIALYPNDPRSETAKEWLERFETDALETRLERRLARRRQRNAASSPIERAYLEAVRAAENDPDDGVEKLTAFVELFASASEDKPGEAEETEKKDAEPLAASDEKTVAQAFVAVATRKLERLEEEREKNRAEDVAFLKERWEAAKETAKKNRGDAEKTRRALLELYGDFDWAREALREARTLDWSVDADENAERNAESAALEK